MTKIVMLVQKFKQLFLDFLASEQASGLLLIICTAVSVALANSPAGHGYQEFWHTKVGFDIAGIEVRQSLVHLIDDGLMTVFFLLIGLEIEREVYVGELSSLKQASLPIFAALGGMAVPALLHYVFNAGTPTQAGAGIPTATDIAFALGILGLFGNRVPLSLKIFLTALAIIDDLGAILLIAIFYVSEFSFFYLSLALAVFAVLVVLNRLKVLWLPAYLVPGALMWYFMLKSGVHPTIVGVLLAFAIPFGGGSDNFPSYRLQHALHKPVAYLIMPIFAMANTGIVVNLEAFAQLLSPNALGILSGLVLGKPAGIVLFSLLAVSLGLSQLPSQVNWKQLIGVGFLGGIGFTMSIFITLLAYSDPTTVQVSKLSILVASLLAGTAGYLILHRTTPRPTPSA
ncbi:Na(+)/H(+) antiporter NhaA [Geomonas silvestris]|uniref:Na(+)/H(+) antiporter NhaA n=1 Tax=Geomonas silvestris TaxID=2740184 RepID=A0A6V8MDH0_9BACT|nr:Na+/H+ antiporter NhaA [Geomonas silvestris]GFO58007.1 Na(+)/H(+) antiporter NhaA [Geomonas silvestris]